MRRSSWYLLAVTLGVASAQVVVKKVPNAVAVTIDGGAPTTFFFGPDVTKPFLYPLRTAQGTNVSRRWPMEANASDSHDHIHHRGVWFAHADVNGVDFWNSDPSYHRANMGHTNVSRIRRIRSGDNSGSIDAELDWMSPANQELLHERRVMTFFRGNPRIIDFDITLRATSRVTFHDEKDGVFGMRLATQLDSPDPSATADAHQPGGSATMTGSTGCHNEAGCWGTRADWLDVTGVVDGQTAGVTVFDFPENPRFPTYWHARGYGLLAANVFGTRAFTHNAAWDGSLTLEPGQQLRFRYRILVHSTTFRDLDVAKQYTIWSQTGHSQKLR